MESLAYRTMTKLCIEWFLTANLERHFLAEARASVKRLEGLVLRVTGEGIRRTVHTVFVDLPLVVFVHATGVRVVTLWTWLAVIILEVVGAFGRHKGR